jgi:hypothetical protein
MHNHVCQCCGLHQDNSQFVLDVHHIDYDKNNCNEDNLVTLCRVCHPRSNYDRDYWYAFYRYIMDNK